MKISKVKKVNNVNKIKNTNSVGKKNAKEEFLKTKECDTKRSNASNNKLSELQQSFKKKMEGARFRTINEQLYSRRGDASFQEFQSDPSLFDVVSYMILTSLIVIIIDYLVHSII